MRRLLTTILLALTAVTGTATAAHADKPIEIVVDDTANVLDMNTLLPAIEDIDFYEPTTVAIYTRAGDAADNFNEEVLTYARASRPEWISPDGQKWADGLYIFAFDPQGRQVGTYMGEDRKVSPAERTKIQEATHDLLADAQWTDGAIEGVEAGSKIINRPWYRSPVFIGFTLFGGAFGCIIAGKIRARGRRNLKAAQKAISDGDKAYSSVSFDLDVTELNANTIPRGSSYGAKILAEYRSFMDRYEKATRLGNEVRGISKRDLRKGRNRKRAEEYAAAANELDDFDDAIADANSLLNMAPGWEKAWDRQTQPLLDDLERLGTVTCRFLGSPSTEALVAFGRKTEPDLRAWATGLADRSLAPEAALDRLRDARRELSSLLAAQAETAVTAYGKTPREQDLMRRGMNKAVPGGHRRRGIIDNAYPSYTFDSVGSYNQRYSSGQAQVDSARQEAQQSSSGYGSSGGSFSGSGSSSRF